MTGRAIRKGLRNNIGISSTIDAKTLKGIIVLQNRLFLVLDPICSHIFKTPNVFRIFDFDLKPGQIHQYHQKIGKKDVHYSYVWIAKCEDWGKRFRQYRRRYIFKYLGRFEVEIEDSKHMVLKLCLDMGSRIKKSILQQKCRFKSHYVRPSFLQKTQKWLSI